MRKSLATAGAFAIMVGGLAACSTNEGDAGGNTDFEEHTGTVGTAEQSKGPAPEVEGAEKGGTVTELTDTVYNHLDPTQTYYVDTLEMGNMFARKLTQYRVIDGENVVVGDLATDPGKDVKGDCTTWEYNLKDGIKYEDGSEIVADDIAYAISRSFALTEGPQYFVEWLKGAEDYKGPFEGDGGIAPGITVEGDKKITFEFSSGHCDMPYMASMSTSAPLPKDKDTDNPEDYDKKPFSSGPYKFAEAWSSGKGVTLVRNDQWDPNTDPIRHQYPDEIKVSFNMKLKQLSDTLVADQEADQHSFSTNLDPTVLSEVADNEDLAARHTESPGIFTYWIGINNETITDPDVRKALNYAIDKTSIVKSAGGSHKALPASTVLNPTVNGYKDFDLYGGDKGDKEKAKELLKGKDVPKLTYAYRDTNNEKDIATNIQEQLKEVGVEIDIEGLPEQTAPATLTKHPNDYDLYMKNWGADWPSGSTTIPPIYDGRTIRDEGNVNNIFYDNDDVNAKIDEISAMPDLEDSAKAWGELDEQVMKDDAPMVPLYYSVHFSLAGSKVGGLYLTSATGTISLTDVYAKK